MAFPNRESDFLNQEFLTKRVRCTTGGSLDKIAGMHGYEFDWNDNSEYDGHDVGVVAQEVEAVFPEVVRTNASGYKAVRYEKLVPVLIQAVKELHEKVEHIEKNCECLNK